jgi:carbamoyl-phosphate synthase large subunit
MRQLERYFKVYPCGFAPQDSASCCLAGRDRFVEQPRDLGGPQYQTWIVETCKRIGIDVVLPVRDGDMQLLANMRSTFSDLGVKLVLSPSSTISIANDKLLMYKNEKSFGVKVPVTVRARDWQVLRQCFPLFAKDRYGAGSAVAHQVWTPEEVGRLLVHHPDLIVQSYVGGQEYTVDMFFDWDHRLQQAVVRKRVSTSEGQMDRGEVVEPHENLQKAIWHVAGFKGFTGPINVQFIENHFWEGDFWMTDINVRFAGGVGLTIASGADFVRYLYELVATGAVENISNPQIGTRAIGFLDYIYRAPCAAAKDW